MLKLSELRGRLARISRGNANGTQVADQGLNNKIATCNRSLANLGQLLTFDLNSGADRKPLTEVSKLNLDYRFLVHTGTHSLVRAGLKLGKYSAIRCL